MRFYSEKDVFVSIVFWGTVGILIWSIFHLYADIGLTVGFYIYSILMLAVAIIMAYTWLQTYYEIKDSNIQYRSGLLNGHIDIHTIRWIKMNKTKWAGFRPALARHGIIIRYKTYSEIYFSPLEKERFVEELQKINPKIEIIKS